jgi:hypothetical protein
LGWLLVCEPDYQSAEGLAVVLHASRGDISMAMASAIGVAGGGQVHFSSDLPHPGPMPRSLS